MPRKGCASAAAMLVALCAVSGCSAITGFGDLAFGERDAAASGDGARETGPRDAGDASFDADDDDAGRPDGGDSGTGCVASACSDGIACTEDTCDADGNCAHRADDALCAAGSTCDTERRGCVGGGCDDDGDCNDGVMCTDDRCDGSVCVFAALLCDDGEPCTLDICDPDTGACTNPASPNGIRCDEDELAHRCCAGSCVDTRDDAAHCGGCAIGCGTNASCEASVCTCDTGFQSCDGAPGCESREATDPLHCGDCDNACSTAEPTCSGGRCSACATSPDCADDGLACTTAPTCTAGRCEHPLMAQACLIDGQCRASDERDPVNECRVCSPRSSQTAWTVRAGQACNDTNACTDADVCSDAAICAGAPHACADPLACTMDGCDPTTGACTFTPIGTGCVIAGECVASNAHNPSNVCQICDPTRDRAAWSPVLGGACDDGLFCTTGDTCTNGASGPACAGVARVCDDSQSCTTDSCDEMIGACRFVPPTMGGCFIDVTSDGEPDCVSNGAQNPVNSCQYCNPAESTTAWTDRLDGDSCGTNRVCCDGLCRLRLGAPCSCVGCTTGTCCGGLTCCSTPSTCCGVAIGTPMCCIPPCSTCL